MMTSVAEMNDSVALGCRAYSLHVCVLTTSYEWVSLLPVARGQFIDQTDTVSPLFC